jgi:hypothetical protein
MSTATVNIKKLTFKEKKDVLSFHDEVASLSVYSSYFGFNRLDVEWIREHHEVLSRSVEIQAEEKEKRLQIARKQAHLENEAARLHGTLKGIEKVTIKKVKKKK